MLFSVKTNATNNTVWLTSPTLQTLEELSWQKSLRRFTELHQINCHDCCSHNNDDSHNTSCTIDTIHKASVTEISGIAYDTEVTHILTRQSRETYIIYCKSSLHKMLGWKYFKIFVITHDFPIWICSEICVRKWSYLWHALVRQTVMVKLKFAH